MSIIFETGHSVPFYWVWAGLVIIFVAIEAFTFGLTTIWMALASLVMIFLSYFLPIQFIYQIAVFIVISGVLLYFTRPLAIKKFKAGKVKTNVDSLVGMHALVTVSIGEFERGQVKLNGQIWTARTEDGKAIEEGVKCEVVRIEGVQAIVRVLPIEN